MTGVVLHDPDAGGGHGLSLRPELGELARLMDWTDALAVSLGLGGSLLFALRLCLEEAVSNAIRHGGAAGGAGTSPIAVRVWRDQAGLRALVEDRGVAFDPLKAVARPPPATLDEAEPGGLGIGLMREFAGGIDYQRIDGANRLVFCFNS